MNLDIHGMSRLTQPVFILDVCKSPDSALHTYLHRNKFILTNKQIDICIFMRIDIFKCTKVISVSLYAREQGKN